jgi:hypothetical protein
MKMLRRSGIAALAVLALVTVAWAIQPGTDGTDKRNQNMGIRSAVLIQETNNATASAGAVTLNAAGSGIITTEALSSSAGSPYTLTLTNNMVAATDIVLASVQNGLNTAGNPYIKTITPAAGSVVIVVGNSTENSSAAFNNTLKISFLIIKQSALGSD